jgi:hypothetical protein
MRKSIVVLAALTACKPENTLVVDEFRDPNLVLEYPAAAAWVPTGDIKARGVAENLEQVTVNEAAAPPEDGRFQADISLDRGMNLVEATGVDMHGDPRFVRNGVLAGEFKEPHGAVDQAARLRVNQGGLDAILAAAAPMMDVYAVAPMITNPIYTDSYDVEVFGFGFELLYVEAHLTQIWYDQPVLSANPTPGVLKVHGELPNVYAQVYVWADVAGLFTVDGTADIAASRIVLDVPLTVGAPNHRLTVGMNTPVTRIDDFWFDLSLIPSEIEGWLLSDFVEGYLEDTVPDMMLEMLPGLVQSKLDALDPSFETDLMGNPLSVDAEFSYANVDDDGVILDVDLDVDMPGNGALPYEGYLTGDEFGEEPDPSHSADIAMSLYDDLLNRVMFEVWSAGVLNMQMSSEDGSLSPLMLAPLHATEGTIGIEGMLPPVIVKNEAGELEAQIGELMVTIDTPDGELGHHLVASITMFAPLEIRIENNVLALELGDPVLHVTVRESDWGAENETVTNLLEEMLPIDTMLAMFGDFEFPLPALPGISVAAGEALRDGDVHTNVTVDLQ